MNVSLRPSWLAFTLTVLGAAAIAYSLLSTHTAQRPVWVLIVALASVALWVLRSALAKAGFRRTALACAVVLVVAGSLVAAPTDGLTIAPAAIGVLVVVGDPKSPLWAGLGLAAVGSALVALGALPFGTGVPAVLAMLGGLLLAVLGGISRRQYWRAEEQAAQLREQQVRLREEASRVAIARDLHDVLAHSLGGLVIQLDAVEALLESGQASAARSRVAEARRLAGDGLAEARRAVAALRDPVGADASTVPAADVEAALRDLVLAHRSLGAGAELVVRGSGPAVNGQLAVAVERALQEALTNARKHAPGAEVHAELEWQDDRVRLIVTNPLVVTDPLAVAAPGAATDLGASGGRYGLEGMRERFAALPLGGSAAAAVHGDRFVVVAEGRLR